MARAYASAIIKAPVETVWNIVRDFNGMPNWVPNIADSKIEGGLDSDVVGCVRSFHTVSGAHIRERLISLDDQRRSMSYNFVKPAFPVKQYLASVRLMPVTHMDETFIEREATFDEAPGDEGKYVKIISDDVFAASLKGLAAKIKREKPKKPEGAERWKAWPPNKVWTSRVIDAAVEDVWSVMRDFSGMGAWHGAITKMHMLKRARSDKVSGTRDFCFDDDRLHEELIHLDDLNRSFSYRITKCDIAWTNYVSGPRLWPITATNQTFGVWTGDWAASAHDDLTLIPKTEQNVYQRGFAELEALLKKRHR